MSFFTTPPLPIRDLAADAKHHTDGRLGIRWIVLHHTGGTNSDAWLSTTSNPPVSVQRLIKKSGENIKIVQDGDTAYTQGPAQIKNLPRKQNGVVVESVNDWALAIEFENLGNGHDPYPAAQLDMGARQCVEWWGAYGLIPIVGHGWIQTDKNDPAGFPWAEFYQLMLGHLKDVLL